MMGNLQVGRGRTRLRLDWQRRGRDLYVHIGGGRDHIGAVGLVGRSASGQLSEAGGCVPPHREAALAASAARRLHAALSGNVCVTAGVHLERITRAEIAAVRRNAGRGIERLARRLRDG